jgi:carbamoyl-phosphate synthase small subunit
MVHAWPGLDGRDMVKEVTCTEAYPWLGDAASHWVPPALTQDKFRIAAYDYGIKRNILRHLDSFGVEALALNPDGIFLSNGPGDPAGLPYAVEAVADLIDSGLPILGICLGHQLIGRAVGGETERLKFGHHGGNHPVLHLPSGKALITAQNHNYCVRTDSLDPDQIEVTYTSLNDGSLEGMRLKHKPVFSVQFHPEASPGPHDAHWTTSGPETGSLDSIFGEFIRLLGGGSH